MDATGLLIGAGLLCLGLAIGVVLGRRTAPAGTTGPTPATGAELATLLAPAAETLRRVEHRLHQVESERVGAFAGLAAHLQDLTRASSDLGAQTRSLAGALRSPTVRGRWGELQLQRVVELAGMTEHCDFDLQVDSRPGDRAAARPDLVVTLPAGRQIPVDAKTPLDAWLQLHQQPPADEVPRLRAAHARAVRQQVDALAGKSYWDLFQPAPDFVVMFLPGEALLDAALQTDPGLLDHAFGRGVVLATPTTLLTLLRTIEFGWRQDRLADSAEEILALGRQLHDRLHILTTHLARLGNGLERAVDGFNAAMGSLESRVLVSARRFTELGVHGEPLAAPPLISSAPRRPRTAEPDELDLEQVDGAFLER